MNSEKAFTYNGYDIFNLAVNALFAVMIVSFSIISPQLVVQEEELEHVGFGFPIVFLIQDLSDRADYGSIDTDSYPIWVTPGVPMEYPTDWKLFWYALDIFMVWWFFLLCYKSLVH